ncbi:MAG: leucine-rich repeat protein, partial [Bacilli bacterium]|nr:leucine-rich repeat protein [Bacilli bacterium]
GQTWNLNLPTTITNIGTYAFYQRSIIGVSGNIMFSIGTYAFAQCPGLAAVDFVETRTIGGYAFYLNTALAYVSVGIGGTNYGNYAFYQEASTNVLAEFRVMNTTPPTIYAYTLPPNTGTIKPTIYVPDTAYSAYNAATYWKNYTRVRVNTPYLGVWNYSIINTNEIHIISYVGNKQTADIPDYFTLDGDNYNVTSLGASAFPAVQTRYIDIPRYMVIINVNVLGNTKRVNTFTVDANNTTFSATSGVLFNYGGTVLIKYPDGKTDSSYTIPTGTTAIASTAFAYNTSLTTLSFPSSLVVISHDAFTACTNMRTYNFAGTTPPILPGFIVFPYYSNMYINVPSAAEATYEAHYAYYYYRARIFGV